MDSIRELGGVVVDGQCGMRFGVDEQPICAAVGAVQEVDEPDFTATYDPVTNSWTAAWKWSDGKEPGVL
ncbi:hypothetical protein E2C01_067194 [Portunus trituberculatus]|uniref:Uncharacterized protein n=1 Tax=Portunus trituberculatus TaxID=210409 RepID=A0A5B7HJ61_PORTR|nr:hypothetical protein [Portunus trituberculatus]